MRDWWRVQRALRLQLGTRGTGCDDPALVKTFGRAKGKNNSGKPHRTVSSANCSASTTSRIRMQAAFNLRPAAHGPSPSPSLLGPSAKLKLALQSFSPNLGHWTPHFTCRFPPVTGAATGSPQPSFRALRKPFAQRCTLLIASACNWLFQCIASATRNPSSTNTSFSDKWESQNIRTRSIET